MDFYAPLRELFRWYLKSFPLRDGKAFFYRRWHQKLVPSDFYVTIQVVHGFLLQLDLKDPVQRWIYFFSTYDERYEAEMVRRLLDPNEVFWDVGANIGYFSLLAAGALRNTGQVVAFEPGRIAYRRLLTNIALNEFGNITPVNLAVLDRAGEVTLYLAADTADGGANVFGALAATAQSESCQAISLDEFCRNRNFPFPDFIKIDVEGAELQVLCGAQETLLASRPLLLLEMKESTLSAAGTTKGEIQARLRQYGYQAAFPHRRKWHLAQDVAAVRSRNVLWFQPDKSCHRQKIARLGLITK
jgi:FkbM family methyltransferase